MVGEKPKGKHVLFKQYFHLKQMVLILQFETMNTCVLEE